MMHDSCVRRMNDFHMTHQAFACMTYMWCTSHLEVAHICRTYDAWVTYKAHEWLSCDASGICVYDLYIMHETYISGTHMTFIGHIRHSHICRTYDAWVTCKAREWLSCDASGIRVYDLYIIHESSRSGAYMTYKEMHELHGRRMNDLHMTHQAFACLTYMYDASSHR